MKLNYTPGPWHWTAEGCPIDIRTYQAPGYYANAELSAADGTAILSCGEYDIIANREDAARVPNALLIAAAPDLLAALEAVAHSHPKGSGLCWCNAEWGREHAPRCEAAQTAIAKAKGEL